MTGTGTTPEEQKLYFVENGARKHVLSYDWVDERGLRREDIRRLPLETLLLLPDGGQVSMTKP